MYMKPSELGITEAVEPSRRQIVKNEMKLPGGY